MCVPNFLFFDFEITLIRNGDSRAGSDLVHRNGDSRTSSDLAHHNNVAINKKMPSLPSLSSPYRHEPVHPFNLGQVHLNVCYPCFIKK